MKSRLVQFVLGRKAKTRSTVLGVVVGAMVFGLPSASWAAGDQFYADCALSNVSCQNGAQVWEVIGEDRCEVESHTNTEVCIDYDSDTVYVLDGDADGNSAIGWVTNTHFGSVNQRVCRNKYGQTTWVKCNFNWVEDDAHLVGGGVRIDNNNIRMFNMWSFSNN